MIKIRYLLMTAVFVGAATNIFALDLSKWQYQADLIFQEQPEQYFALTFTPEIYNIARVDLADIRIVDANGQQVPYLVFKPKDISQTVSYNPRVINRSTNAERQALVTLDFGSQVVKNIIEVITDGDNFRREVRVEGSNDNIEFSTLVEQAYVFAIGDSSRFNKINLPVNDYHYLKITVKPMMSEKIVPTINQVKAFKSVYELAPRSSVNLAQVEHYEDGKNNRSVYIYDFGYCNLPVSEIRFEIADESFYRSVTVEGRDSATRKIKLDSEDNRERFKEVEVRWSRIATDAIYRYRRSQDKRYEKLRLSLGSRRPVYRCLKITIENYDDKPIEIKSVSAQMIAHKIIFEDEHQEKLKLYVGCKSARAPAYDIRYKITNPAKIEYQSVRLRPLERISPLRQVQDKMTPWTEKHKVLLVSILVLVVLVLGGFILKSLLSIRKQQN